MLLEIGTTTNLATLHDEGELGVDTLAGLDLGRNSRSGSRGGSGGSGLRGLLLLGFLLGGHIWSENECKKDSK